MNPKQVQDTQAQAVLASLPSVALLAMAILAVVVVCWWRDLSPYVHKLCGYKAHAKPLQSRVARVAKPSLDTSTQTGWCCFLTIVLLTVWISIVIGMFYYNLGRIHTPYEELLKQEWEQRLSRRRWRR